MKTLKRFSGTFTALVTPFQKDGSIDFGALGALVDRQIEAKIEGLIVIGTTGESPTLSHTEKNEIIRFVVERAKGKTLVVAGTGTNDTASTLEYSREAAALGVDAILLVNPYYNKPTQEGLYRHFKAVADAVNVPQILYNIQGRTGVNLQTDTLVRLAAHPNIVAVKEASGDLSQMMEVIQRAPADFTVLSGDDNLTFPLIALGGHGVISVLSNLVPKELKQMVDTALQGKFEEARAMHYALMPLMKACFIETNPIPVKTALAMKGLIGEIFRLPLCEMGEANRTKWQEILKQSSFLS